MGEGGATVGHKSITERRNSDRKNCIGQNFQSPEFRINPEKWHPWYIK